MHDLDPGEAERLAQRVEDLEAQLETCVAANVAAAADVSLRQVSLRTSPA